MHMNQSHKIRYSFSHLIQWGRQNRSIIQFCLLLIMYMTCIYFFFQLSGIKSNFLNPLSVKVAQLSNWFLNLFGMKTQSVNSVVFQPNGFAIDISYKCTGILQIEFFIAAICAYPCSLYKKLPGFVVGTFLIFSVNLIRIISLFFIGLFVFSWFDFIHGVIWELLMILITFFAWLFWLRWMRKILKKI